jgi:hypothetical protein
MGVSCLLENDGIMGSWKLEIWIIGKIHLDREAKNALK